MLITSITQTVFQRQEKEQKDKIKKHKNQDSLQAKREADRIFSEKQQLKAQQLKEDKRKIQDFNVTQMVMLIQSQPQITIMVWW